MHTFRIAIQAAVLFALPVLASSDHQRVHLLPQFKPGDSLRYQIESQMTIAGTTTGTGIDASVAGAAAMNALLRS